MIKSIKHWSDVCKIHWKEIITLAVGLHWVMDLLIIIPISLGIGKAGKQEIKDEC